MRVAAAVLPCDLSSSRLVVSSATESNNNTTHFSPDITRTSSAPDIVVIIIKKAARLWGEERDMFYTVTKYKLLVQLLDDYSG